MNSESDFKKVFHESVRKQGGFSFPIAMSTMSGLPDLYCAFPGFIPVLLEAKWLKNIPELGKFKRKIPYRPLQQEYLRNASSTIEGAGWCLIGLDCGEKKYCGLIDPSLEIVTHDFLLNSGSCIPISDNKVDVRALFRGRVPLCENRT